MLIVIFVLVFSLTISEEAVTFPDTSCWRDFLHSVFVVFKYKVFMSDNIYADTDVSVIG